MSTQNPLTCQFVTVIPLAYLWTLSPAQGRAEARTGSILSHQAFFPNKRVLNLWCLHGENKIYSYFLILFIFIRVTLFNLEIITGNWCPPRAISPLNINNGNVCIWHHISKERSGQPRSFWCRAFQNRAVLVHRSKIAPRSVTIELSWQHSHKGFFCDFLKKDSCI